MEGRGRGRKKRTVYTLSDCTYADMRLLRRGGRGREREGRSVKI